MSADDPRLLALISELSSASERFKQLWEQADVGYTKGINRMRHPAVGDVYLTPTQLDLAQSPGQYIITLHAPANSASMHATRPATRIAAKQPGVVKTTLTVYAHLINTDDHAGNMAALGALAAPKPTYGVDGSGQTGPVFDALATADALVG